MQIFAITYKYMYICEMKNRPTLIQLSFSDEQSCLERYMVIVEMKSGEIPKLHLVPVPTWLVFYSEKYKYYCINLN